MIRDEETSLLFKRLDFRESVLKIALELENRRLGDKILDEMKYWQAYWLLSPKKQQLEKKKWSKTV